MIGPFPTPEARLDYALRTHPVVTVEEVRPGDTLAAVLPDCPDEAQLIIVGRVLDADTITGYVDIGAADSISYNRRWAQLRMIARAPVPEPTRLGAIVREEEAHTVGGFHTYQVPAGSMWVRTADGDWTSLDKRGHALTGPWAEVFHRPVVLHEGFPNPDDKDDA